jgi:hypothetical protein
MRWLDDSREARVSRWIVSGVVAFLALHIVAGIAHGTYPPKDIQAITTSSPGMTAPVDVTVLTTTAPTTSPPPANTKAAPRPAVEAQGSVDWDAMADCESGDWDANKQPIPGTARWDDQRGGYEGGLHFLNGTWLRAGGGRFAQHAYDATREQQIEIADSWLARTDLGQWPKCSYKIGAR